MLAIERLNGRRSVAELRDGRLLVRGPNSGAVAAVERWYRRTARERLTAVGKAFWQLVEAARPGWQHEVRWLRENCQELHDYTVSLALQ